MGIYWNWNKSIYEYIKFTFTLLFARYVYENIDFLNNNFTKSIPVGWIVMSLVSIILISQIVCVFKWTKIWLRKRWKPEWLIIHWGIYLIIISIIFSISFPPPTPTPPPPSGGVGTTIQTPISPTPIETKVSTIVITPIPTTISPTSTPTPEETKMQQPRKSEIDDNWVLNFMTIVNNDRVKKGLSVMKVSSKLNNMANIRFEKMMEKPFISHYGISDYNVGEVVLYPDGFTEQNYAIDLQKNAYLHWDGLMNPSSTQYGYHIEEGQVISVYDPCSETEIPGADIDVKEFFEQHGCRTIETNTIWLVIDMT